MELIGRNFKLTNGETLILKKTRFCLKKPVGCNETITDTKNLLLG